MKAFEVHTQVHGRDVDQACFGVVRHRHPVFAANQVGANVFGPFFQARTLFVVSGFDRSAGFHVDAGGPVDAVNELFGRQKFAVSAVNHVEEAVTVSLHQDRNCLAVDRQVSQHQFIHAVIVPCIMRCELVVPHDVACVRVHSHHRSRVQIGELADIGSVIAANNGRPRRRIAGAVVNQVQLGIVRTDEPCSAAAGFA